MRRLLSALLIVALVAPSAPLAAQGASPVRTADAELSKGVRQVDEGDFDAALITLDAVVRRLQGQSPRPAGDLANAYLYLGIAYLGLSQEQSARTRFLEAVRQNRTLELDPKEYPPRVVALFQDARREMGVPAAPRTSATATTGAPRVARGQVDDPPARPSPPPSDEGGGGSKTLLIVGGVLVVGGVVAALALAGGGDGNGGNSGPRTQTFSSADVPRPIRDFTTTTSTVSASGFSGAITSVSVNVSLSHTFIGDLVVGLRSPAGTEIILHNREGGSTQNLNRSYSPPGFNGQQANGTWTLRVSDEAGADIGQINSWSITITAG